jgi:2-keto-4-pentenoate hydratase/2-oxohepta-3-ene-1,7-dioic acid hydratase in catechol pathway
MRIGRVAAGDEIGYAVLAEGQASFLAGPPIGDLRFTGETVPLEQVKLLAPVLPSKIVCVGKNYAAHAVEMGGEVPSEPLLFLKPSTSIIGPGDAIRYPHGVDRLDHESELAVVVGRVCTRVSEEVAAASILGYTCANDVSARDYQVSDGQWTRAKGFDTFCPLGPWIETELDVSSVRVRAILNGETRQDGDTADMVFKPAFLVSYISQIMTLLPGDVILTGTPDGVGPMKVGDSIEVDVSGIGALSNRVIEA